MDENRRIKVVFAVIVALMLTISPSPGVQDDLTQSQAARVTDWADREVSTIVRDES